MRKAKSAAKLSPRTQVARLVFSGPQPVLDLIGQLTADIEAAGHAEQLLLKESEGSELIAHVEL